MSDSRDIRTPPRGVPVGEFKPDEEITGVYTGPALLEKRAQRDTHVRIARQEAKTDTLADQLAKVRETLSPLPEFMEDMRENARFQRERDQATFTDSLDARKTRRAFWLKLFGLFTSGGVIGWIASHL